MASPSWRIVATVAATPIVLALCGWLLVVHFGSLASDYDPRDDEYVGQAALDHVHVRDGALPRGTHSFWVFDGGSFNGSIYYLSFRCDSIEDCWAAVGVLGGPDESLFGDSATTRFAVNYYGPNFYWREIPADRWKVAAIRSGRSFETAHDDRVMDFWAVDRDTLTVYHHHESGGFPTDLPSTRQRWTRR